MPQFYFLKFNQFSNLAGTILILALLLPALCDAQILNSVEMRKSETLNQEQYFPLFGDRINYHSQRGDAIIKDAVFFELNQVAIQKLMQQKNYEISLDIPVAGRPGGLKVNLKRKNIFGANFKIKVASNPDEEYAHDKGLIYHGSVEGTKDINVVFSIFQNEIFGWVITPDGNFNIGRMQDSPSVYTCYLDKNAPQTPQMECKTADDGKVYTIDDLTYSSRSMGDCIKVFVEVDNSIVVNQGSVIAANNFVINAFAQSSLLYAAEGINLVISEMLTWDMADPYSGSGSGDYLNIFKSVRTSINGADLGHLVAMVNNGGIAAGFDAICNPEVSQRLCYSGFSGVINPYPAYSFIATIITHEMGHLLGSRHTHACVWNGNGTAIDGCSGFVEGNCALPGSPAGGGTIMSYCHNDPVGVNFAFGFGPQPSAVINNSVNAADCLTSDCSACDLEISTISMTPSLDCDSGNGSITVVGTSSSGPFEYSITGPVNGSNLTGVFTGLPNGVYVVGVSDLGTNGCKAITYQNVNISSADVPKVLAAVGNSTSTLNISSDSPITGIKLIGLQIKHGWVGDLSATLTSPEGTVINLFARPGVPATSDGCDWSSMYVNLYDAAASSAANLEATCNYLSYAIQGDFRPIDPLNVLIGENPMGNWTLTVNDAVPIDGGSILNWGLELCGECVAPIIMTCSPLNVEFNGLEEIDIEFDDIATASSACGIDFTSSNPASIDCNAIGSNVIVTATATDINGNTNSCTSTVTVTGLPCGWNSSPNGINCTNGSEVTYNGTNDEFTLEANGCYYQTPFNSQSLAYVSNSICGNGSITAHVLVVDGLGYAGVTIRESGAAGAKMVTLMTNRTNFHRREARTVTNGPAIPQQLQSFNRFWLRLVRQGNLIIGYTSSNGMNWNLAMQVSVSMVSCIEVGLVATNGNQANTVTAIFGSVVVTESFARPISDPSLVQQAEQVIPESFELFPNPGSDIVTLKFDDIIDSDGSIIVYDAAGRIIDTICSDSNQEDTVDLNISDVPVGLYFVKYISDKSGEIVKKLVIHR